MPEGGLDSRSEFDHSKAALGRTLREMTRGVRALTQEEIKTLGTEPKFVAGWQATAEVEGEPYPFEILVDVRFPYSPIRIANQYARDQYLRWPHIEPGGLLCLPQRAAPSTGIEPALAAALGDAVALLHELKKPSFVEAELKREFVSYWHRSRHANVRPVRSLLEAERAHPRRIAVWFGEHFTLVGETRDQLLKWLESFGAKTPTIEAGLFVHLGNPPSPPFPAVPQELFALIADGAPEALSLLVGLSLENDLVVALAAKTPSGTGLVAARVSKPTNYNGFRKGMAYDLSVRLMLWGRGGLTRTELNRFDAGWVHGRGKNAGLPKLSTAQVIVLGCGSLGSQVAFRLAQCGVGALILIDPDSLSAANVGRHALGISSVGENKAAALAKVLRKHFPHMSRIEERPERWQSVFEAEPELTRSASLIVASMGEWAQEAPLDEWHARGLIGSTIVYGWLEEFGVASHAIALCEQGPKLKCLLDQNGDMRSPETEWDQDQRLQAEPACGTLFQPFGPLDAAQSEVLVSRLCIDVLTHKVTSPCHRIHAGSSAQLQTLGGRWSAHHEKVRPPGFAGPLEFERPLEACGQCNTCRMP